MSAVSSGCQAVTSLSFFPLNNHTFFDKLCSPLTHFTNPGPTSFSNALPSLEEDIDSTVYDVRWDLP